MIQQTPWFERRFSFDFPVGLFPVIFSRLEGSIFRLYSLLANADDELCSQGKEGWSVKQHLGHLIDLEDLWWQRLQDYANGRDTLTMADLTNQRTEDAGHNEQTLERLLEQFTIERQRTLEAAYGFDEEFLQKTATHPRLGQPMRVIDALFFVAEHDDHHISALSNLMRRPPEELT